MATQTLLDRLKRSEAAQGWLLISPTAIYALLLLAAPLITIFAFSFMTDGYLEVVNKLSFCNYVGSCGSFDGIGEARVYQPDKYVGAWSDPIFRKIMLRSLTISIFVTLATVVLAYPIAYFVSFHVKPERKPLWLFLITIPFWTSYLIRVFLWKVILGYGGVINSGLLSLGIIDDPLTFFNYSTFSIVLTLAHAYAPFAILPIFVALEKIDRSLLEAARDLGEGYIVSFLRVTLPLSMVGVVSSVLIVFIPTVGDYVTPSLVGGGKIPMVANLIQSRMLDLDNKPAGAAMAVSAMAIVALVSIIFLLLNRRYLKGNSR